MVTIDWSTRIINIPKADLVNISGEFYKLDAEWFRRQVIDIMDGDEGIVNPDPINHNTEVTLSGVTYARVIEIINGYKVSFEAGSYAVRIDNANTNFMDVIEFTGVSMATQNSAGLIQGGGTGTCDGDDIKAHVTKEAKKTRNTVISS